MHVWAFFFAFVYIQRFYLNVLQNLAHLQVKHLNKGLYVWIAFTLAASWNVGKVVRGFAPVSYG